MMSIFDADFHSEIVAGLGQTVQFVSSDGTEFDIDAIFDSNIAQEKMGNAPVSASNYSLSFSGEFVRQFSISANAIFRVGSQRYKAFKKPFIDSEDWATVELIITN